MNNLPVKYELREVETMANVVARSGLFGIKEPTQAMALMLLCQAEGLHPMVACQRYHIIQGRASMASQTVMALFMASGGKQEVHELSEEVADVTLSHPSGGSARIRWTMEQARKAGLAGKDNWKNHPRSMLLRRAQAEGVRAVAPFVLQNLPVEDELEELPTASFPSTKPDLNIDKLGAIEAHAVTLAELPLDTTWDRETKARVERQVKLLGGSISKAEKLCRVPVDKLSQAEEFIAEIMAAQKPVAAQPQEADDIPPPDWQPGQPA